MDEAREEAVEQAQQQLANITAATTTYSNRPSIATAQTTDDDAWWWEVENGDLILDLVPNIDLAQSESENSNNNNNNNNVDDDNSNNYNALSEDLATLLQRYSTENIENLTTASATITLNSRRINTENTTTTTTTNTNAADCIAENSTDEGGIEQPSAAVDFGRQQFAAAEEQASSPSADDLQSSNNNNNDTSPTIDANRQQSYDTATPATSHSTAIAATVAAAAERGGEQTLEEFKEELRIKRLARQTAVQDLRDEISTLRRQLAEEQELTRRLRRNQFVDCANSPEVDIIQMRAMREERGGAIGGVGGGVGGDDEPDSDDDDPQRRSRHANIELANAQLALQMANAENLSLRTELGVVQKQVGTLKEVIACCKQMLSVKEEQCVQLKNKLDEIETAFSERETKIMSSNLRQEYERQLGNIRQLRQLYEERQRIALAEQENLQRLISIKRDELAAEQQKVKNIEERNQTLLKEIESANNELATVREECNEHKFEKKTLKEEMGAVNTLFSQVVMGFNGENNLDIDRLTTMLEENRGLLNDMATNEANCTDGATLPKLLFELVEQAAISSKSKCSITPTPAECSSESEGEYVMGEGEANHRDDEQTVNVTATIKRGLDGEEEAAEAEAATTNTHTVCQTVVEGENIVHVAVDHNYASGKQPSPLREVAANAFTASSSSTSRSVSRKHQRKSGAGNRMKLPTAVGSAAVSNAESSSSSPSSLKTHEPEVMRKVATTQEIIGNLPKVWKVLMELLSHHKIERVAFEENGASEDCYKSIETANGPKAELSVSKTYIKLKDLIMEKKSLVKETNRLKTLNCHLEYRLNEQEKRLSAVSLELTKTWHLVGKMQRQHRQLHTQEQILRYQLQQKRRLLSELKEELEYCRRKWAAARAKNDESQEQCNDLRREFALRKLEHANNSAESGYSDSGQVSDEEAGGVNGMAVTKGDDEDVSMDNMVTKGAVGGVASAVGGAVGGAIGGGSCAGGAANACRRKRLKEMFEHTRKIKRMQSTSPGRAGDGSAEIVLRWNSAPPTCGWWRSGEGATDDIYDDNVAENSARGRGAIPKLSGGGGGSRNRHRSRKETMQEQSPTAEVMMGADMDVDTAADMDDSNTGERAERIQRLEEQCKSLIQKVLETSDNREKLEVQLLSFHDEIAPPQHAVPLNDFVTKKKRIERMTRASSVPVTGTLTPREEEYTRKRSERLERLEEESRQLMSRIKRTSDRGHYLRCSLDRLRRGPSREGSFESNTEEDSSKSEEKPVDKRALQLSEQIEEIKETKDNAENVNEGAECPSAVLASPLTENEEAYTARRAARLQRLESESRELLNRLSRNNERGEQLGNKLDALHEQHSDMPITEAVTLDISAGTQALSPTTEMEADNPAILSRTSEPVTDNLLAAEALPSTATDLDMPSLNIEQRLENIEQISSNRLERLRILEEEGKELLNRLAGTSARGTEMINRIAEREQNRQETAAAVAASKKSNEEEEAKTSEATRDEDETNASEATRVADAAAGAAAVAPLIPMLNNVACSSIVSEELTEHVTVTTTPSQIAAKQGAIPKQKPAATKSNSKSSGLVLNAAKRAEAAIKKEPPKKQRPDADNESLEEMVRRLRETPFPDEIQVANNTEKAAEVVCAEQTIAGKVDGEGEEEKEQQKVDGSN